MGAKGARLAAAVQFYRSKVGGGRMGRPAAAFPRLQHCLTRRPHVTEIQDRLGALINTNLKGRLVHSPGVEQPITLTEAVVTDHRVALDWSRNGQQGHLIAKSTNGTHFSGRYGYGQKTQGFTCELTLYKSNHEDLLYGTWRQHDTGEVGTLILRLPSRMAETALAETARSGDPSELAEGSTNIDSSPAQGGAAAEIADSPAPGERRLPPRRGAVAPLRLAPGTSKEIPSPRPSKVAAAPQRTEASRPATRQPAVVPIAPAPVWVPQPPAAMPPASGQIDHLLAITPEQFAEQDRGAIEKELLSAPVSALFKVAHNALAPEMRGLAARMFADRYGELPASTSPKPPAKKVESPEMKAHKRRSSRRKSPR